MDIRHALKQIFKAIYTRYVDFKRSHGLYDFTDLPLYLLDKLREYDEYINDIDGFFVDEFQDVDDVQLEVFNRVLSTKKFFIGDSWQSIYIFRGASIEVLNKLQDFTVYQLDVNYRSYQEIIDFATTYRSILLKDKMPIYSVMESFKSDIDCVKGKGGDVYVIGKSKKAFKVNDYSSQNAVEFLKEHLKKAPMILCRTNKQVKAIQKLGYQNVQTIHQAKGLEYSDVIVTDFDVEDTEDINIFYVAMTRAENSLIGMSFGVLEDIMSKGFKKVKNTDTLF